jgi:hypothetical protein
VYIRYRFSWYFCHLSVFFGFLIKCILPLCNLSFTDTKPLEVFQQALASTTIAP